jgi:RNA recognition motif-containing protein
LVKQVKVLRDQNKVNSTTGDKISNGIGFAELENQDLAVYAINYLNNMELVNKKGLIVDFSMEDQRALLKMKKK